MSAKFSEIHLSFLRNLFLTAVIYCKYTCMFLDAFSQTYRIMRTTYTLNVHSVTLGFLNSRSLVVIINIC